MNKDQRFAPKSVVLGARTGEAAVAVPLDKLRESGRLELEAGGEDFTAIYDPVLDTGYLFRGRTEAQVEIGGPGPNNVSWSGGEAPEPVNGFEAMWFAWAAFYPETAVHG
jgi:hypothetical protein